MKPVRFLGDSLERLREFPDEARQDAGYQLELVQRGLQPTDFKPMSTVGKGVEEIRIRDDRGQFRVIYLARLSNSVFVLHAFQKKSRATSRHDIAIAKERYADLMRAQR
jgi:phage-related protein